MSDNKKYYYLKLKDNFFDSEDIKILESMDNGYKYSNILLKMYLKSLKREGLLIFKERIPYNPKMIATVTGHNINDVKQALVLFQEMGLIEMLSNGAIYMMDIQNYIGTSSTEADRIRAYRNEIKAKKEKLLNGESTELIEACTNVQQTYTRDRDRDRDRDRVKEEQIKNNKVKELNYKENTNIHSSADAEQKIPYQKIIDYLNDKTNSQYRDTTSKTRRLIKARWNEGFDLDDFKSVIDIKARQWLNDKKMSRYLRPQTLFGTKFEGYLNEEPAQQVEYESYEGVVL